MIRIDTNLDQGHLPLGQLLDVHLHREEAAIEARFYFKHKPLFYLKALTPWDTREFVQLMPEAPGAYSLLVTWRHPDGRGGWLAPIDFEVGRNSRFKPGPRKVQFSPNVALWTPSEWEAMISMEGEKAMIDALQSWIRPGFVIYDIGANIGKYAIPMAQLAGSAGFLYCVEANPVCIQFLATNLALNKVSQAEILPVALLDQSDETHFTVNYGNIGLGLSESSGFYAVKAGHEIGVRTTALDDLIEDFQLRPPDLIKLDVEGVEHLVIRGMKKTLEEHHPVLLLELHGEDCVRATLEQTDAQGYSYLDPVSGTAFSERSEVLRHFGDTIFQLVAVPV